MNTSRGSKTNINVELTAVKQKIKSLRLERKLAKQHIKFLDFYMTELREEAKSLKNQIEKQRIPALITMIAVTTNGIIMGVRSRSFTHKFKSLTKDGGSINESFDRMAEG